MSRISHFSRILLLLTLALLPRLAQAQRIGPLGPTDRQQSKALSTERAAAAVGPPSLQLSLSPPAAIALPPLGPDDLQRLQPQEGQPPVIGVHRRLPAGALMPSFSEGTVKTTAEGAWQSTAVGRLWRLKMTSPSARAMRIHFRDFAIGAGSLWLHSASGQVVGPYTGSGLYGDGDFWSGIVFGDSLTIEYLPDGESAEEAVPFEIVAISHVWDDAFGGDVDLGDRLPEEAWGGSDRRGSVKPLPTWVDVAAGPPKRAWLAKKIQTVERYASLQQSRPKAAKQLTPGQPAAFRLGPVDESTLFHGDFSFRLEVPENASHVTFTLESNVDVDMYVRFGQDNDLLDGMVVTDYYSSRGPTGNEKIVISRQSDPPLRAGTYFVSLGVFDTGVVARCTLTAEMELDEEAPPPISGGPLVPGQPADFRLGPVDNPTLFNRDFSFRLEVPENPYRVTLTVTMDSFINVDLYVRFGEDNDLRNRRVVSDYASERLFGNEEIVITLRSDPPLRAGTYFISLGVRTTGVVAEGTVTAIVERNVPISGGPLTPGQPAAFRLGPVDTPTIFFGNDSFRLEVPENATRVIFTLESVDPDVDVDMFVRFGQNNDLRDGTVVTDYFSGGPTGNERIGITRRSNPPLRVGTHFVSLGVRTTGLVAEGTVTAKVETDAEDCHLDVTCYSEWSTSATSVATIVFETSGRTSRRCSGTLLTNRRQDFTPYFLTAAHCVDTEAEARSVTAYWFYQTQTCNGELPDFQTVPRTEGAHLLATLGGAIEERVNPDGDMTLLQLEGDLPDGVWFQGWDANPQPIGAQVTGIHHPGNDDWGFFKRLSFGQIIPGPGFGTFEDDVYAVVSYTQGYTQPGSSGSALFNNPGTVVGAISRGRGTENICRIGGSLSVYTHFSVFYPHIRQFIDGDSPLTPGQPATFRLEPVDTPTIFLGGSSFRLEVPENASRVTFTLESVDPDINVDLYVRYGEDNDIRDGRVISDYSSEGPTGNEEIIITRQSDPPLRAGTYFVSLGVRTTGVVAEGTVRAEFDTPQQTGGPTYYFPHLAVGQKWQTTITYINYSSQEVRCTTEFLSDQGTPLMVSFADKGTVPSRTDVLVPGGSVHQETNVELNAPFAPGWARATCSGPVKASLLFRLHNSEGVPIAEGGVNAAAVPATRFVTFAEQGEGKQGTGVAYANPSATEAVVTFTARDADGQMLASVDKNLSPNGHAAQNMAPLFALSSFTGSLEVTSTAPIVSLSINAEAAPVFSSLPPGELDAAAQGSTTYYFPHLAVGQKWQTTITYINYSSQEVRCQTDFISDHGSPLMVSFAALGTVVSRTDVLLPGGSVHQETNVELNAPFAPGWVRATCSGPVKASLLFRLHNSEGVPIAEGGVNAAAVPATRFVTFAEQGEGKQGTGVAYANPSATEAVVTFTAKDALGQTLASVDKTLLSNEHAAQNMAPLFALSSFTGSLEVTSTVPIVSLSINAEAAPVFSSLPPGETPAGEIPASDVPDLVVQTPSVSDSSPNAGESFMLSATVRNQGNGRSASTTLRYYHSLDATISTGDTEVGTDAVGSLTAAASSDQSISLTAPSSAGTYYYGACVDPVSGEYATRNNCSRAVTVTVASSTGDPWSRPNIERFRGTWQFTYTKDRAAITDTFRLNFINERSDEPGEWAIGGLQDDGSIAVLFYSRDVDIYVLAHGDKEDEVPEGLYSFNLISPTIVSGCYHEILSSTSLSSCYPMTGVRTSSSTLSSVKRAQPNTTAAQPELDSKIIRVLEDLQEDLREVLRQ